MSTHSLPTKGFMHVNLAQWMVPLVRNISNYCETGSRVLGCLLVLQRFPTSVSLWCLLLMKWKAANWLSNSSAFFGLHVKWWFFFLSLRDGLCSTVSIPSWRTQWRSISAASTAVFPVGNLPTPLRLPLTNTAWTRELCKHQILLY